MKPFTKTLALAAMMLCATVSITFSTVVANDASNDAILKGKQLLQTGTSGNNATTLNEAAQHFVALAGTSQNKSLCYYYAALAHSRLIATTTEEAKQDAYLEEATKYAEQAIAAEPNFADAHALLGSCYGRKAKGVIGGMKYGPKSSAALEKALEFAPKNPRVLLFNAVSL